MDNSTFSVRRALPEDLPGITAIYNYAVRELTATFDTRERTDAEQQHWFAEHGGKYPVLVAVAVDRVLGWASLSPFGMRGAFARTVESSVYIDPQQWGRGIGSRLMQALMAEACAAGHHAVIARITTDNAASIHLHHRLGFTDVGIMREVGWKFNRWIDLLVMEAIVGE